MHTVLTPSALAAIRKICVFGWGLIGDLFIRVPLIEAIRERFPESYLEVVVDPAAAKVLTNHPACNRVVGIGRNKRPLYRYLTSSAVHAWRMHRAEFDLSVDLYNGGSSIWAARVVSARWRIAFSHKPQLRAANNVWVERPTFCQHWSRALAELLRPLGIDPDRVRRGTSYYCLPESRARAKALLRKFEGDGLVAFNLGGGHPRKRWPVENFVALAEALQRDYGLVPVVYTNPGLEPLTDTFCKRFRGRLVALPRIDFDVEAAIMERCRTVVSGDSALMHLAFGLRRPTLGLFTATRPEAVTPEDCVFVPCLVEDPGRLDGCGRPAVSDALPVEKAMRYYAELERRIGEISEPPA